MAEKLREIINEKDEWMIAEGENENIPFILRFRPNLRPFIETQIYNIRVIVISGYDSESADLLPSDEQFESFNNIEEQLISELEKDLLAVLAFVYTGDQHREWHFYSNDSFEVENRIRKITSKTVYPKAIDIQVESDPLWEEYNAVLKGATDDDE
jgi:hypothetical protein